MKLRDEEIRDKKLKEEEVRIAEEAQSILQQQFQNSLQNCMCTTGYNFEGYKITKYIGLISGEAALGTGFFSELSSALNDMLGTSSTTYQSKLVKAKKDAVKKMILNAVKEGANAIIGIDFDILTLQNNMILVSANGTAVHIEKNE